MRRAKKRPNIAVMSGFTGSDVPKALASFNNDTKESVDRKEDFKNLTEEQKVRLRAAGYKIDSDDVENTNT